MQLESYVSNYLYLKRQKVIKPSQEVKETKFVTIKGIINQYVPYINNTYMLYIISFKL